MVIALFVVVAVLLVWLGRRQTDTQARTFGRVVGVVTAVCYLAVSLYSLIPPAIDRSVPLNLTDLATMAAAYAWWSQRQWAFALTYYWGLVLSIQALISPALRGPDFPGWEFLGFWSIHLLVVWGAIYLTWGRRMRPDWRSYRLVAVVSLVWLVFTFTFNRIAGTNYGFLNGKPATSSLLDVMGPWPVYVIVATTIVFVVWALMTWPWTRTRQATPSTGRSPSGPDSGTSS